MLRSLPASGELERELSSSSREIGLLSLGKSVGMAARQLLDLFDLEPGRPGNKMATTLALSALRGYDANRCNSLQFKVFRRQPSVIAL